MRLKHADILGFVQTQTEETQTLEFKRLFEHDQNGNLSKSGKREVSKHVGGMVNGAGGTIVIGVQTEKQNGVDKASAAHEIEDVSSVADRIKTATLEYIFPQQPSISVYALKSDEAEDSGFVVIEVKPSTGEPVMSTASGEHRYYRRGADGTRIMDHLQIKQLMFRQEGVELDCRLTLRWAGNSGNHCTVEVGIALENNGVLGAKNPTVQLFSGVLQQTNITSKPSRRTKKGYSYFLHNQDTLFPGEEVVFATMNIYVSVDVGKLRKESADKFLERDKLAEILSLYTGNPVSVHSNKQIEFATVSGIFAGENCGSKPFSFQIDRFIVSEALIENDRLSTWLGSFFR